MKSLASALVLIVAFTTACAQDTVGSSQIAGTKSTAGAAGTDNIDRHYVLTQAEGSNTVSFLATFYMSGTWNTTVRLDPPAHLAFNGRPIGDQQLISKESAVTAGLLLPLFSPLLWAASGTHYYSSSQAQSNYGIQFTDQLGTTFSDQMRIYPCAMLSSSATEVSVAMPGAPGGVEYYATLTQDRGSAGESSASANSSDGHLVFPADELARFTPGPATLKVECQVATSLSSEGSGAASGTSVYQLRAKTVMVGH